MKEAEVIDVIDLPDGGIEVHFAGGRYGVLDDPEAVAQVKRFWASRDDVRLVTPLPQDDALRWRIAPSTSEDAG